MEAKRGEAAWPRSPLASSTGPRRVLKLLPEKKSQQKRTGDRELLLSPRILSALSFLSFFFSHELLIKRLYTPPPRFSPTLLF